MVHVPPLRCLTYCRWTDRETLAEAVRWKLIAPAQIKEAWRKLQKVCHPGAAHRTPCVTRLSFEFCQTQCEDGPW